MESNYDQQQESNKGSLGVGRWYECVYCKRGFNTAQALGGHMNIHRKKRDSRVEKNNIESIVATTNKKQEEEEDINHRFSQGFSYHDQNSMQEYSSSSYDNHHHHFVSTSTRSYFPDTHHQHYGHFSNNHSEDHLSGNGEWNVGLDYNSIVLEKNREVVLSQKEDLDLELRLGL